MTFYCQAPFAELDCHRIAINSDLSGLSRIAASLMSYTVACKSCNTLEVITGRVMAQQVHVSCARNDRWHCADAKL